MLFRLIVFLVVVAQAQVTHSQEEVLLPEIKILDGTRLDNHLAPDTVPINGEAPSLISTFNSESGVRMEERSPGSYRFSIRGSLIRSPFGVRNIKFYYNGFSFSDAGGNTYLNLLDPFMLENALILKGPQSSRYGCQSGGTVFLNSEHFRSDTLKVSLAAGSYETIRSGIAIGKAAGKNTITFSQGLFSSSGYRQHSQFFRSFQQVTASREHKRGNVKALFLHSSVHYQTPGGLNKTQFDSTPQMARPASGMFPGAVEQKAGVQNGSTMAGLSASTAITPTMLHKLQASSLFTHFQNPFITNYETRDESTITIRNELSKSSGEKIKVTSAIGNELSHSWWIIETYKNKRGNKGELLSAQKIQGEQNLFFASIRASFPHYLSLLIEASSGVSKYKGLTSPDLQMIFAPKGEITFTPVPAIAILATLSKGVSPPTIFEIASVTGPELRTEEVLNRELRVRLGNKGSLEAAGYIMTYDDLITRTIDITGTEVFFNTGRATLKGIEVEMKAVKNLPEEVTVEGKNSFTLSSFRQLNGFPETDVPGIPRIYSVSQVRLLRKKAWIYSSYTYSSSLLLSLLGEYAEPYHLISVNMGREVSAGKSRIRINLTIDNLLNENYTAGPDLNAAGGRFYNPAPGRNFLLAVTIGF